MSPRNRTLVTTRDITTQECPWLGGDIPAGTVLFEFVGCTYGCVSNEGVAIKLQDNNHEPFYEVPLDAVAETAKIGPITQ